MKDTVVHSFEAGRRGKPDELDSIIANSIAAYIMSKNNMAKFDLRVHGGFSSGDNKLFVALGGEISEVIINGEGFVSDIKKIVIDKFNYIHQSQITEEDMIFELHFTPQSGALADNAAKEKIGDSGTSIAVAYAGTPVFLPWERFLAVGFRDLMDEIYFSNGEIPEDIKSKSGVEKLEGLGADGKIEFIVEYDAAKLIKIKYITIATVHDESLGIEELQEKVGKILKAFLSKYEEEFSVSFGEVEKIIINGAGAWTNGGGWPVDAGSREAKPYRDAFSSYGVVDDSFSGEDPSKGSAANALLARKAAVFVVKEGLADFARVTLTYTIGAPEGDINIFTNGTNKIDMDEIYTRVRESVDLTLATAIEKFGLRSADYYKNIASSSDYFQNSDFEWNK
ncbi:MAG TPA: methionine adenosyltransferase domain-containing protein [Candidatus Dojkabacteria bacterium]|jgi:S-adenosylmethionine synthetase